MVQYGRPDRRAGAHSLTLKMVTFHFFTTVCSVTLTLSDVRKVYVIGVLYRNANALDVWRYDINVNLRAFTSQMRHGLECVLKIVSVKLFF